MDRSLLPPCTLVTACYDLNKYGSYYRSTETLLTSAKELMETPVFLVIYGDDVTIPLLRKLREHYRDITIFRERPIEEWWNYKYIEQVRENRRLYSPSCDHRASVEHHLLMSAKFEFILEVMKENPFSTSHFGWIDLQLRKIAEAYTPNLVPDNLNFAVKDDKFHINILGAIDEKYRAIINLREYYQQYRWVVCGCFFVTGVEIGRRILSRLKEEFVFVTNQGYGHADEMLYLRVLDEYYDSFVRSYGDYQHLLHNFIKPTRGFRYIYSYIVIGFLSRGQNRSAFNAAESLISSCYNTEGMVIEPEVFLDTLFARYIASFYCCRERSKDYAVDICVLSRKIPEIGVSFDKKRQYYEEQLRFVL